MKARDVPQVVEQIEVRAITTIAETGLPEGQQDAPVRPVCAGSAVSDA